MPTLEKPKIIKTAESPIRTHFRLAIHGAPKTGKTRLACTAPSPLIFDFDDGLEPHQPWIREKALDVQHIPSHAQGWEAFESNVNYLAVTRAAGFETIVIDTISRAQALLCLEITGRSQSLTMSRANWGEALSRLQRVIEKLVTLPCHLLLLAHTKSVTVEDERDRWVPAMQGQLGFLLSGLVDTTAFLGMEYERIRQEDGTEKIHERRCLRFHSPDGSFECGDRLHVFNQNYYDDLSALAQVLRGEGADTSAEVAETSKADAPKRPRKPKAPKPPKPSETESTEPDLKLEGE